MLIRNKCELVIPIRYVSVHCDLKLSNNIYGFLIFLDLIGPRKRRLGTQLFYGTGRSLVCKVYSLPDVPFPFSLLPDEVHYICSQERITRMMHLDSTLCCLGINLTCVSRIFHVDVLLRWNVAGLSIACCVDSAYLAQGYDRVLDPISDKHCRGLLGDLEIHEVRG